MDETVTRIKRIKALADIASTVFDMEDWELIERNFTGGSCIPQSGLYQAYQFGDDNYRSCIIEVISNLALAEESNLDRLEQLMSSGQRVIEPVANPIDVKSPCKVFISHKAEEKRSAHELKRSLAEYGIRGFVAHDDIEVTALWQSEIEKRLQQCDAFIYMASDYSNNSQWCQQEVGWALGRGIPIASISLDRNPVAFLGSRQALALKGHNNDYAAKRIFELLMCESSCTARIVDGLVDMLESSSRYDESCRVKDLFKEAPFFTDNQVERIKNAINNNNQVSGANWGKLPSELMEVISSKMSIIDKK